MKTAKLTFLFLASFLFILNDAHTQSVTLCYTQPTQAGRNIVYSIDGVEFSIFGARRYRDFTEEKLENSANFGGVGAACPASFTVVPLSTISAVGIAAAGCDIIDVGISNVMGGSGTDIGDYSTAEWTALKTWSDASLTNIILAYQGAANPLSSDVYVGDGSNNDNPNSFTSFGTDVLGSTFGTTPAFTQGGTYQGIFTVYGAQDGVLFTDATGDPTGILDCDNGNVYLADVDMVTNVDPSNLTASNTLTSTTDIFYGNLMCGLADLALNGNTSTDACSFFSCTAGTTAPTLTSTALSNTCPTTTADLTTSTATNTPASTTLTWHTGTPATTANKLTPAQAAAQPAGTYYAAFFDATNDCYSGAGADGSATTSVNVTITSCTNPIILNEVNVCTGRIEIHNTGSTTVDVSGYYLCGNSFQYDQVGGGGDVTINSGTTMLAAGAYLDITWADLNTTAGELGLYENNAGFGDFNNMVDYIQYNVGNQARSAVAVTAGVWDNAANFVTSETGAGCNSIGVDNSLTPTEGADTDSGSWCTSALSPSSANGACITCDAGTTAPSLSSTAIFNTCPTTTADLTSITATTPAGATLTWHTGTPATTANKLSPAQAAAQAAGTYYAAFYDATNDCYSGTTGDATTSATVTINVCGTCNAGTTPPTFNVN